MDSDDIEGAYIVPSCEGDSSPHAICARLLQECREFAYLADGEASIAFLLAVDEVVRHGKRVLGMACLPTVQGQLKRVFTWSLSKTLGGAPDFLITLDFDFWNGAGEREREILVYHELCHCIQKTDKDGEPRWDEDGRPVWGIAGHDVEEFSATVRRYGAYSQEIREFIEAARP